MAIRSYFDNFQTETLEENSPRRKILCSVKVIVIWWVYFDSLTHEGNNNNNIRIKCDKIERLGLASSHSIDLPTFSWDF